MSWTELEPIIRTVPRAKASIQVTKAGTKLTISFSETFYGEVGKPVRADVLGGAGENAGKVLLRFGAKGKFTITELGKGGARLAASIFAGIPTTAREGDACIVETHSKSEAVIALPLAAWQAQTLVPEVPSSHAAAAKPAPSPAPSNGTFDVEVYLKKKGHKITRLSSALFVVDGVREPIARILTAVNGYRAKEGLRALLVGEIE